MQFISPAEKNHNSNDCSNGNRILARHFFVVSFSSRSRLLLCIFTSTTLRHHFVHSFLLLLFAASLDFHCAHTQPREHYNYAFRMYVIYKGMLFRFVRKTIKKCNSQNNNNHFMLASRKYRILWSLVILTVDFALVRCSAVRRGRIKSTKSA